MIEEKYNRAISELQNILQTRTDHKIYTALGYTSNLDVLCEFDIKLLNELLAEHMKGADLRSLQIALNIKTIEDLLSTIVYYCANGIGGEVDIEDISMINKLFVSKYGMGGTGVQAALALAAVKCQSIVHLTDDSPEVCHILDSSYINTISEAGLLVHTREVKQKNEQEIHYIIQFQKGDKIELGNQFIEIPLSNRLILTKITVNALLPLDNEYFRYIENHAESISSVVLSSFNVIQDMDILQNRLKYVKEHIYHYKSKNKKGIVFFEDAHYHNSEIKKQCINLIYPHVDIVSMNEEELELTLKMEGIAVDHTNIFSYISGMNTLIKTYHIQKGIVVHTKDYSAYVGQCLEADIESGLIYGNILATAKATYGDYGNLNQIIEIMKLPLSEIGLQNRRQVRESDFREIAVIVPTRYIEKPKYTIGLGDSFVAGLQICFV